MARLKTLYLTFSAPKFLIVKAANVYQAEQVLNAKTVICYAHAKQIDSFSLLTKYSNINAKKDIDIRFTNFIYKRSIYHTKRKFDGLSFKNLFRYIESLIYEE